MHRSDSAAYELLLDRVATTLNESGDRFPYYASPETGEWTTTPDGNWCPGHWVGLLWLAYELTDEERFAEAAKGHTEVALGALTKEAMFYGMNAHYMGYRGADLSGDTVLHQLGHQGADWMVEYFHQGARQVPLGTQPIQSSASNFRGPGSEDGPSGDVLGAVDAMYVALPVLWRAFRETGDPVYRDTAIAHSDRHLDWYIRDDGRTWHHAEFDPDTGALVRQYNELAYSQDTCWARGQGWCIAGLARAYRETGARRYLDALDSTVGYYQKHAPNDGIPHWDFEHPDAPDVPRDTSAAALTAYGLVRLEEGPDVKALRAFGNHVLDSLIQEYLTPTTETDERPSGMVIDGCYNGPAGFADTHELIWTDYYVAMALAHRLGVLE